MVSTITPVDNKQGKYPKLKLKQSITLLESLRSCWSEDILVISCSDKFLRLSLQLLSRSDFTSPVNVSHFLWYFGFTMQTFTYVHMCRLHTRARAHTKKKLLTYFSHVTGIQLGYLLVWLLAKEIPHSQSLLPILSGQSWHI